MRLEILSAVAVGVVIIVLIVFLSKGVFDMSEVSTALAIVLVEAIFQISYFGFGPKDPKSTRMNYRHT